jgi:hypothetical protein
VKKEDHRGIPSSSPLALFNGLFPITVRSISTGQSGLLFSSMEDDDRDRDHDQLHIQMFFLNTIRVGVS